jgi:hypothetical protein
MEAKLAQAEKIAQQTTCRCRDDDRSGFGQGLKARRKAWRITKHSVLSQRALPEPTNDHEACGDANANREWLFRGRLQSRYGRYYIERRTHRSLGIVLVCAGITKIRQYSVTPEISKEAVKGQGDTGASGLKGIDYGAHVLWVQPS